jgi:hypothetical protein
MRTTRRRRGGSTGGVGVGRRCAAGDGLRDTSPVVYGGVDVQACSEERLLLAAGEARRSGGTLVHGGHGNGGFVLHVDHGGGHGVHHQCRRSSGLGVF